MTNNLKPNIKADVAASISEALKNDELSSEVIHVQKIDLTSSKTGKNSEEKKRTEEGTVTSVQVKEWATEEQKKDLEEGEIIDDELQIISITNSNKKTEYRPSAIDQPLKAFTKGTGGGKKRGRKAKKSTHPRKKSKENEISRQKKELGQIHKRKVTINQSFTSFKQIANIANMSSRQLRSFNNSGNQENHSWPSLGTIEVQNENDIDRRTRNRITHLLTLHKYIFKSYPKIQSTT